MPRQSEVEAAGVGDVVMEMYVVRGMTTPAIQEALVRERGVFLSDASIREWVKTAPAEALANAKDARQKALIEPILRYESTIQKLFDDVEAAKAVVLKEIRDGPGEPQEALVARLASEFEVDADDVRSILKEGRKADRSAQNLRLLVQLTESLRRTVETAIKVESRLNGGGSGGGEGKTVNNTLVITGKDLVGMFDQAKKVIDVTKVDKPQ